MPVVVVTTDAIPLSGTGHKIFPRSVIIGRFVFKSDLAAISGLTDAGQATDQQQVNKN
jgi:hypothetical protein